MTKIKICGLSRECDIDFVNEAKPDYAGFVVNFPKSRRNVSPDRARELASRLSSEITPAGVFVDERPEVIAELVNCGAIRAAQLHGSVDEEYINNLRVEMTKDILENTDRPIEQIPMVFNIRLKYLQQLFKRYTGMSMREYRSKHHYR